MKNTLGDLNNHLFAQLERLGDEDLDEAGLDKEIKRAEAITKVAGTVIQNAAIVVKAQAVFDNLLDQNASKPKMLEG